MRLFVYISTADAVSDISCHGGTSFTAPAQRAGTAVWAGVSDRQTRRGARWRGRSRAGEGVGLAGHEIEVGGRRGPRPGGGYLHLIDETARHPEHVDIRREQIDGPAGC
jgi:hypothetical protein